MGAKDGASTRPLVGSRVDVLTSVGSDDEVAPASESAVTSGAGEDDSEGGRDDSGGGGDDSGGGDGKDESVPAVEVGGVSTGPSTTARASVVIRGMNVVTVFGSP